MYPASPNAPRSPAPPRSPGAPRSPYGGSPPRRKRRRGQRPARDATGLCNLGNTCYMNSVLQALVHVPPLRDFYVAPDSTRERADSMGSLGSLGDGPEHHATISPRTPPGLTARPRGSSVDNVIPGTPPRSQPLTQEVPATPPSRRPLQRVNSPTGVGGMAALMTASEQVQNTDVVSLVNAGRIVEAAQAAGTVYGPPPPPPAPYMDRLARYNSMGSKGKVSEAFSQLATELTTGTSPYAVKPSHMKKVMARWRPDFQGYAQHDAHEFLVRTRRPFPTGSDLQRCGDGVVPTQAALLDGLHEDQNLVRERRRMVERRRKEREKRRLDEEAAAAAQAAMRALQPMSPTTELLNDVQAPVTPATETASPRPQDDDDDEQPPPPDSRIEELLGGKFASELVCDECRHQSVTHEQFVCVSLPLRRSQGEPPPRRVSVRVERSLAHQGSRTSFESVLVRRDAPISELLHATSASSGVPWNKLILADVWQNKVHRFFCATDPVDEVTQQDDVVAYEVSDPQAYYPWTARQPLWRRQLCVPYDDRVQGYHNREDARKEDPLLATAVFNVGGTYYGEYNCSKEARACRFEVTGVSLLPPTQEEEPVQEEKHHTDSEDEEEKKPEPLPKSLLPNADVKIIFDFITGNGQQGAYSCEGTYDSTTREARVSPIRWIQRPDRNAVTMVPMTLRVCGGDDGTPTRLVGCVDQCGTVVAWAAGNREDPLEPSPWNQQLPPEEEDDSDADPPRRETARPAASIGIVLYHKLSDEPDDGYHRHRHPLRGTPTLVTMPRSLRDGNPGPNERQTYKLLYTMLTREEYHAEAHQEPPRYNYGRQPYAQRSSHFQPATYQIPARRQDVAPWQQRGQPRPVQRSRRRRIANETDDDEESQRSDAADVDDSLDGSNGYDPNTSYYVNRSPTPARESWGQDAPEWSPQQDTQTYGSRTQSYRSDYRDQEYDDERERSWDDPRYGEFDSGLKGGTTDYYADDSPERNRRQKKRAGLNTAGVSNSYDDEVAGLTKRYRYGNDDDADDDASSSRSPSPQRNTSSSRHWQRDTYYDQPPPRAPVLFFRTDKDGRYLSDDRMRCLTGTQIDDESSEEEEDDLQDNLNYYSGWPSRRRRWGDLPLLYSNDRNNPCQPSVEYLRCEWRDARSCDYIAGNPDGSRDRVEALAKDAARPSEPSETPLTVDKLLKLFASKERLDTADAWKCPGCEKRVRAVKRLRLAAPNPPVLVLHLKRFEMLGYHSAKLETPVAVPSNIPIDIGKYVGAAENESDELPSTRYYLCAVVNHFGTIEFGHYTAYARSRDDGCWRLFNDATVGVRDDDEVSQASRAPYLLFLLREDVAPAEWVRQGKLREAAQAEANAETDSYNTPVPAPQIPSI